MDVLEVVEVVLDVLEVSMDVLEVGGRFPKNAWFVLWVAMTK